MPSWEEILSLSFFRPENCGGVISHLSVLSDPFSAVSTPFTIQSSLQCAWRNLQISYSPRDRRFEISSSKKSQLKSAAQPHHVLERAAELDGGNLINGVDAEGLHVEELVEELARLLVRRANRSLAEIAPGNLG